MVKLHILAKDMCFRLLVLAIIVQQTGCSNRELRTLGFLSITGQSWDGGDSCLTAIQMAVDDVNANENILKDFNLTYTWFDSKVCGYTIQDKMLCNCL